MNFTRSKSVATIGALGLSAIALFAGVKPANAADTCGPGANWVDQCSAGVDTFPNTRALLELQLWDGSIVSLDLNGPATVHRDDPVDAIIGDSILGDVGLLDGNLGVIKTLLEEIFEGSNLTLTGKGVGAIVEATESGINNSELASSFFNVFAEIKGPFGRAINIAPIRVDGNKWLTGVSPSKIPPIAPGGIIPPLPVPPDPKCGTDPSTFLSAIIYCGFEATQFFLVDDDNNFVLSPNGDKILIATLLGEQHVVEPEPIPEPMTNLGAIATFVLGLFASNKVHQKSKKAFAD
jgi:hypothetical protein